MRNLIYADNAATTQLDSGAFDAMKPYLLSEYGNASQPYFFGRKAKLAIKNAREVVSNCINAHPEEVFFTSCGTESDNWVIKSFSHSSKQAVIITSEIEHHAILNACDAVSESTKIIKIPANAKGEVKCDVLESILKECQSYHSNAQFLVSIMTANNEIGTIQAIRELSNVAHKYGALFHTDAVQAVGHIKVNVEEMGIDFLSASAHKFNGPKGIGFLYIKKGVHINPFINGGAQESMMRAGTENVASIVGMAVALKNNIDNLEKNADYISDLERRIIQQLQASGLDFIRNGSDNHIPGNISLSFKNSDGEMILHRMDLKGICISTGSACDSVNTQVSHVIKAIRLDERYAKGTIRISIGKNNTIEEVDTIVAELIKLFHY